LGGKRSQAPILVLQFGLPVQRGAAQGELLLAKQLSVGVQPLRLGLAPGLFGLVCG
jgi:hypothetical protein